MKVKRNQQIITYFKYFSYMYAIFSQLSIFSLGIAFAAFSYFCRLGCRQNVSIVQDLMLCSSSLSPAVSPSLSGCGACCCLIALLINFFASWSCFVLFRFSNRSCSCSCSCFSSCLCHCQLSALCAFYCRLVINKGKQVAHGAINNWSAAPTAHTFNYLDTI